MERGPKFFKMGTKRGLNGDLKSVYLINWPKRANSLKKIFVYKKSSPSVLSFSAQLGWGISINKLVCNQGFNAVVLAIRLPFTGRTLPVKRGWHYIVAALTFDAFLGLKWRKRGLWKKRGPNNSFWSPWGPKSPKRGPTWEQWKTFCCALHLHTVRGVSSSQGEGHSSPRLS